MPRSPRRPTGGAGRRRSPSPRAAPRRSAAGPMDVVLSRVSRGEADLTGVDPRLAPLLYAALSPVPRERPDADEVVDALERYATGQPVTEALTAPSRHTQALEHRPTARWDRPAVAAAPVAPVPVARARSSPRAGHPSPNPVGARARGRPRPLGRAGRRGVGVAGGLGGRRRPARPAHRSADPHRHPAGPARRRGGGRRRLPRGGRAVRRAVVVGGPHRRPLGDLAGAASPHQGPRRSDVPLAVAASPWHLVVGALATVVSAILPLVVGICAVFSAALGLVAVYGGQPHPNSAGPLAVGAVVAALMAWWGSGRLRPAPGHPQHRPRRQPGTARHPGRSWCWPCWSPPASSSCSCRTAASPQWWPNDAAVDRAAGRGPHLMTEGAPDRPVAAPRQASPGVAAEQDLARRGAHRDAADGGVPAAHALPQPPGAPGGRGGAGGPRLARPRAARR